MSVASPLGRTRRPLRGSLPVAGRILRTMRGDRRTLALVFVAPALIVSLLGEVFARPEPVAHVVLAVIVFFLTYILTAIGFLRERTSGTLDRVLVAPVSRTGLVVGYVLGYGVLAAVQSVVLLLAAVAFLDVSFANGILRFVGVELLGAFAALGTGIVLSLFADSEFQAIQFIPVVITPQVILGGTFRPVSELPTALEYVALAMPITHLVGAMEYVVLGGDAGEFRVSSAILIGFAVAAVALAALVVRPAS
ncbi:ABC transporter permease [Halovivax limisalsi]|uniref:ABC transporter permease n=1 Tax=Halovivax limisalsi TaxID=1453760 RepID=UPI001FFDE623|nr:ABC transporter permease [Halovivax limisalsi]